MSISWNLPTNHRALIWFVHGSGIPITIYLVALKRGGPELDGLPMALLFGLLTFWLAEGPLARRPGRQTLRSLLYCAIAVVLATLATWLPQADSRLLFASHTQARHQLDVLQLIIERIWTPDGLLVLGMLWAVLTLTARVMAIEIPAPPPKPTRGGSRAWAVIASASALMVLANLAVAWSPSLVKAPWPEVTNPYLGPTSFLSPDQFQAHRRFRESVFIEPGAFEGFSEGQLTAFCQTAARRLDQPGYELTLADFGFLMALSRAIEPLPTSSRELAEVEVSMLALDRRQGFEYRDYQTLLSFRARVLEYLATAPLSEGDLAAWRARALELKLTDSTHLYSVRGWKDDQLRESQPMRFLGFQCQASLAEMVFDLGDRWSDLLDRSLYREATLRARNPEFQALSLVLDIREQALTTGRYPRSISTELGSYRVGNGGAQLTLFEDGPRRPKVVLDFGQGFAKANP